MKSENQIQKINMKKQDKAETTIFLMSNNGGRYWITLYGNSLHETELIF